MKTTFFSPQTGWLDLFLKGIGLIFLFRVASIPPQIISLLAPLPFPSQGAFSLFQPALHWLYQFPSAYLLCLWALKLAAILSLLLVFAGWKWRITLPASFILTLLMECLVRSWAFKFYHQMLVSLTMLLLMAGLIALHGEKKIREREPEVQFFLLTALSLLYFFSGWSKLYNQGFGWVDAEGLFALVKSTRETGIDGPQDTLLNTLPFISWLWGAMALATLSLEILAPLLLLGHRFRRFFLVGFMTMHLGIFYLMKISFLDSIIICGLFLLPPAIKPKWEKMKLLAPAMAIFLSIQLFLGFSGNDFFPLSGMALYPNSQEYNPVYVDQLEFFDSDGLKIEIKTSEIWDHSYMRSFHFVKVLGGRRKILSPQLEKYLFGRGDLVTSPERKLSVIKVVELKKELFSDKISERRVKREFRRETSRIGEENFYEK